MKLIPFLLLAVASPCAADLIAHYRFDEGQGSVTAADSAGENPGALNGGVTAGEPGIAGGAFRFDGSDGYVGMEAASFLPGLFHSAGPGLNRYTYSAWVRIPPDVDSGTGSVVFAGSDASATDYSNLGLTASPADNARLWLRGSGGAQHENLGPSLDDGEWHHLAVAVAPDGARVYVDSDLVHTENHNYSAIPSANRFEIGRLGRSSPTDYFDGWIDDVQVYDGTLDASAIATLFAEPGLSLDPLTLADDEVTMHHGSKVRLEVLGNDGSPVDPASVEIIGAPDFGTVTVDPDTGAVLYIHETGTPDGDSFTYRATDGGGYVAEPATVTITFSEALRLPNTTVSMPADPPATALTIENAFAGVGFDQPTTMESPPGDSSRLFVAEKDGAIWVIPDVAAAAPDKELYLDLRDRVEGNENENGLKGFAFHPEFATNGRLFVSYVHEADPGGDKEDFFVRLSSFTAADPAASAQLPGTSEEFLINQVFNPPTGNTPRIHTIDECNFGPDGYLYLGIGDGDGHPDPSRRSQVIDEDLWAGLLRLDVDKLPGNPEPNPHPGVPVDGDGKALYSIPVDNPYVVPGLGGDWDGTYNGSAIEDPDKVRSEYFATGLRNPWQFSWDEATGELWLGDVGFNSREEVDVITRGGNYGWVYYEGDEFLGGHLGDPPAEAEFEDPVHVYGHGSGAFEGNAVIGGYVYRGTRYPELDGKYIFGDFVSGNIWTLVRNPDGPPTIERIGGESGVVAFAPDPANGDILMLDHGDGVVRRLTKSVDDTSFPQTLSATGVFADLGDLTPNPGVVAYEANLPFWSDHAIKQRWVVVKDPTDTFGWHADESWDLPVGAIWIKHFDLELERGNPATRERLETRLLVRTESGVYGVSYRWNEAQTEAYLVPDAGVTFDLEVNVAGSPVSQTWQIPSRSQCISCHNPEAGHALSFNTRQLNHHGSIAGVSGNFIDLLYAAGYLDAAPESTNLLPRHVRPDDTNYTLETRARSWLEVNCAYCHREDGPGGGDFDLRSSLTLGQTGIIDGEAANNGGDPSNKLIVRGSHQRSTIWNRATASNGFTRMPPLASSVIDEAGTEMLREWIEAELPDHLTYNEWRTEHFGDATSPEGEPGTDADLDGFDNRVEYLTRTEPRDPSSFWTPAFRVDDGTATFGNLPHLGLRVETSETLDDWEPWDVPGNDGLPTAGPLRSFPLDPADSDRFFRLQFEK